MGERVTIVIKIKCVFGEKKVIYRVLDIKQLGPLFVRSTPTV